MPDKTCGCRMKENYTTCWLIADTGQRCDPSVQRLHKIKRDSVMTWTDLGDGSGGGQRMSCMHHRAERSHGGLAGLTRRGTVRARCFSLKGRHSLRHAVG